MNAVTAAKGAGVVLVLALVLCSNLPFGEAAAGFCADARRPYIAQAAIPDGFCAIKWATGLGQPRTIRFASNGDALVVDTRSGSVFALWDANKDGVSSNSERVVLATVRGLTHSLVIDEKHGYVYASTDTDVWRWHYAVGQRTNLGTPSRVIYGMPSGGHVSRTLEMDDDGNLYVSIGSQRNIDKDDARAMIRRFIQPHAWVSEMPWGQGEVWARGLRNEVGLRFDYATPRRLWGVENGVDNVRRGDMGDVHTDNPAEEVNIFDRPGAFYGYPYCWTEYNLEGIAGLKPGHKRGTQWLHPSFERDNRFSDDWCDNPDNVVKPVYSLHAHTAPLDIVFYNGTSFPASYRGDAFVALHGSWNRPQPVGYSVVRLVMNATTGLPEHEFPFFAPREPTSGSHQQRHEGHDEEEDPYPPVPGWWDTRPVSLDFGPCGASSECLFITSDKNGIIIAVAYGGD